jgi:predicted RNase H-like nuclease (RuvC/YqgF family)
MTADIKSISTPSSFNVDSHEMNELRDAVMDRDATISRLQEELHRVQVNSGQMLAEADMEINKHKNIATELRNTLRNYAMLTYKLIKALERLSPNNELTPKARKFLAAHPENAGSILRQEEKL